MNTSWQWLGARQVSITPALHQIANINSLVQAPWETLYVDNILHLCTSLPSNDVYLFISCPLSSQLAGTCEIAELIKNVYYLNSIILVTHIMSSVSKIQSNVSVISYTTYGVVYFSLPVNFVMIIRICEIYIIIIVKLDIRIMNHCLGLGQGIMMCTIYRSMPSPSKLVESSQ